MGVFPVVLFVACIGESHRSAAFACALAQSTHPVLTQRVVLSGTGPVLDAAHDEEMTAQQKQANDKMSAPSLLSSCTRSLAHPHTHRAAQLAY
eukprot:1544619-Rhodomonas_salina.2